LSKQKLEKIY